MLVLFLGVRPKIVRMVIAGVVAWIAGVFLGFVVGDFLISIPIAFTDFYPGVGFGDGYCVIMMGIIYGGVFGAITFGRKSILLFAFVCGIVAIPAALFLEAMYPGMGSSTEAYLKHLFSIFGDLDIYFLMVNLAFGVGAGLSIGLYRLLISRKNTSE